MSDKEYRIIKRELQALLEGDSSQGRELLPLYNQINGLRRGRQGRYRKGPLALKWISLTLAGGRRQLRYIERQFGASAPPLVRRRRPRATEELEKFLERLVEDDQGLHDGLFGNTPELVAVLSRYKKSGIVERFLVDGPEIVKHGEWQDLADSLETKRGLVASMPLQETELIFSDMLELGLGHRREVEKLWREVRKDDRLTGRIFDFVRSRMKHRDDWIKLRDLQRRFTKTNAELRSVLQRLADHRLLLWDKKRRVVQTSSYDPRDKRNFRWLAGSSWPRSPFESYLEKGKVYRVKDFRASVVETWARDGDAEYL